jgi:hypothetical protein
MNTPLARVCRLADTPNVTDPTQPGLCASGGEPCEDRGMNGEQPVQRRYLIVWVAVLAGLAAAATVLHSAIALIELVIVTSLAVHECGHALAARLLQFNILFARLGNGPTVLRVHVGAVPIELRFWPLTGMVAAGTTNPRMLRARVTIYAAAGVLTTIAVAAAVFPVCRHDLRIALTLAAAVQALNLLPIGFTWRNIPRATDGLLIVKAIFGPRDALEERYVAPFLRQQYLQQIPRDPAVALDIAHTYATLTDVEHEAAVMITCAELGSGHLPTAAQLANLWSATTPGWTDMLLAWCTDKTVRAALTVGELNDEHVAVLRQASVRIPNDPDLTATLTRARTYLAAR